MHVDQAQQVPDSQKEEVNDHGCQDTCHHRYGEGAGVLHVPLEGHGGTHAQCAQRDCAEGHEQHAQDGGTKAGKTSDQGYYHDEDIHADHGDEDAAVFPDLHDVHACGDEYQIVCQRNAHGHVLHHGRAHQKAQTRKKGRQEAQHPVPDVRYDQAVNKAGRHKGDKRPEERIQGPVQAEEPQDETEIGTDFRDG